MCGLGSTVNPESFTAGHVAAIAPVVLGQHAWSVIRHPSLESWFEFKRAVEARFGLPKKALVDAFYHMTITEG